MSGYPPRPSRSDADPSHPLNRPVTDPYRTKPVRRFRPTGEGYVLERRWLSSERELPPIMWGPGLNPNPSFLSSSERAMFQVAYWFEFKRQLHWS